MLIGIMGKRKFRHSLSFAALLMAVNILGLHWLRQQGTAVEIRMFCLTLGLVFMFYFIDHGLWRGMAPGRWRILVNALQGAGLGWFLGAIALGDATHPNYQILAGLLSAFTVTTHADWRRRRRGAPD